MNGGAATVRLDWIAWVLGLNRDGDVVKLDRSLHDHLRRRSNHDQSRELDVPSLARIVAQLIDP